MYLILFWFRWRRKTSKNISNRHTILEETGKAGREKRKRGGRQCGIKFICMLVSLKYLWFAFPWIPKLEAVGGNQPFPSQTPLWFSLIAPFYVLFYVLKNIFRKNLFRMRHKIKSMLQLSITNDSWTLFSTVRFFVEFLHKVKNKLSPSLKENLFDKRSQLVPQSHSHLRKADLPGHWSPVKHLCFAWKLLGQKYTSSDFPCDILNKFESKDRLTLL